MPYAKSAYTTNTALQDVCFDYMQEAKDFIHQYVFTDKPVKKANTKVYQTDTSKLRLVNTQADISALAPLIDEQLFSRNINLVQHKLAKLIDPIAIRDSDIPEMLSQQRAAKVLTNMLLTRREYAAGVLATTAANYASTLTSTLSGTSQWDNASSNPEEAKQTADTAVQALSGIKRLNAMACDIKVIRALKSNAAFIERTKYTKGAPIDMDALKLFFDVDHLFVAGVSYDSANEGGTRSLTSPWGKDVIFFHHNPSPSLEDVSFGHMYLASTPFWDAYDPVPNKRGPGGAQLMQLEVGTEYALGMGYVESSSSEKFAAGYLYKSVIA
jgi:hypothetical protein